MELRGPTFDSLELRILGYEAAEMPEGLCEANRLRIYTRVSVGGHVWQTIHPCLLTWEVLELADWLDAISVAPPAKPELNFQAPNLWFEVQSWSEGCIRFRAYFEREHRPPGVDSGETSEETWADLECSPQELNDWANDFRQQLQKFPPRGKALPQRHFQH